MKLLTRETRVGLSDRLLVCVSGWMDGSCRVERFKYTASSHVEAPAGQIQSEWEMFIVLVFVSAFREMQEK